MLNKNRLEIELSQLKISCTFPKLVKSFRRDCPLKIKKRKTRQSRTYAENPHDVAVFLGYCPPPGFFKKKTEEEMKPFLDMV